MFREDELLAHNIERKSAELTFKTMGLGEITNEVIIDFFF